MIDPILFDDWHPVAVSAQVTDAPIPTRLLGQDLVLWRDSEGEAHAWEDRCPHRGTRLSIGRVVGGVLSCQYHGWRFGPSGRCVHVPAQPQQPIPSNARVRTYPTRERYGMLWACIGTPKRDVLPFPETEDSRLRQVVCGPYAVNACGPRIVENFLDMAHFGFVHHGILGDPAHAQVCDYRVERLPAEIGDGILATGCVAWQPQTNSLAHSGSDVEYTYRVVRPLTAILTKVPEVQVGFREAISLHVQPVEEESSIVWMVLALTNFVQDEGDLRGFQDRIFLQDLPVLENQVPKRLPLNPLAEIPVSCDRMSVAYRRYLSEAGLRYGVLPR